MCPIIHSHVSQVPPLGPSLFFTNKERYKSDNTHNNTWCASCVDVFVRTRQQAYVFSLAGADSQPQRALEVLIPLQALLHIQPIFRKVDVMETHKENNLSRTRQTGPYSHVAVRGSRRPVVSSSVTFQVNSQLQASSSESSLTLETCPDHIDVNSSLPVFTAVQQKELNDDFCRVFVSCEFAWRAVDDADPEMHIFKKKWVGA